MSKITVFVVFLFSFTMVKSQSSNAVGDAFSTGNNCYTITNAQNWQLGAVWFNEQLNLSNPFEITLDINFGSNDAGADGVVFIMQQVGLNAIGNPGGGMGFDGFAPSLGIEMDTFYNVDLGDIPQDHMGVFANGTANHNDGLNLAGPVTINPFGSNVEDGQDHIFKLVWDPDTQLLSVYFDCELRIQLNLDLIQVIFGGDSQVFWGFSAATGGENNAHTVCISEFALGLDPEVTVCDGESVQLGVVGAEQGTYAWEPATYLSDPAISNPICNPESDINYTVTFTDVCGEVVTLETEVEVVTVDFDLPEEYSFCDGEQEQINVPNPNNYNLLWDNTPAVFPFDLTEGDHVLLVQSDDCEQQFLTNVEVLESPEIIWDDEYFACENEEVFIDASFPGATYLWHDASEENSFTSEVSEPIALELTGANGCSTNYTGEVIIYPLPMPNLPELIELCQGETEVLQPAEGIVQEWSTGSTEQSIEVNSSEDITVSVESAQGCGNTDDSEVIVSPSPSISDFSDQEICEGESFELNVNLNEDWNYSINGQELLGPTLTLTNAGTYNLVVSIPDGACSNQSQFELTTVQSPSFDVPEMLSVCEGEVFELTVDGLLNYDTFWNGEETSIFQISEAGAYELLALNQCGAETKEVEVIIEQCSCVVYTPNAFTPDNDGINDKFGVALDCDLQNYQLRIFNRWGQIVFDAMESTDFWDGSMNDSDHYVQEDIYQWQLSGQANLPNGIVDVLESGFVAVIR